MDSIGLHNRHLQGNAQALYKDLLVNGMFLQDELKTAYPDAFSKGRYRDEFIPVTPSKAHPFESQKSLNPTGLLPVYGCQDDCCIYLYANCKFENNTVIWIGIAQDSYYFGPLKTMHHQLQWLPNFKPFHFNKEDFENLYQPKHNL